MTGATSPWSLNPAGLASAPLNRRDALRLLALGLSTGLAGCKPAEYIVPLVANPDGLPAGVPLQFATSLPLGGYGRGMLVTSIDGRPTKISGNAAHPASLGASDIFSEADILGLYDPDRSRTILRKGQIDTWDGFLAELRPRLEGLRRRGGEGLSILTGRVTSPTMLRQFDRLRKIFPALRWHRYEALSDDQARASAMAAFGRRLDIVPHLERADVVLALGADPLGHGPGQIRNAAAFGQRRTVRGGSASRIQRLYAVESSLTLTGIAADHRLALAPREIEALGTALAVRFEADGSDRPDSAHDAFISALAADLHAAGSGALVLVGEDQPATLHALGHRLNAQLGAFGTTLDLIEPVDPVAEDHGASIAALAADLAAGQVDTLLVLDCNPAYDAPVDLGFAELLGRANWSVHLGLYTDETAERCLWHVPESHTLEAWSDLRGVDGTAGIVQPLIRPLYTSRAANEIMAALSGIEAAHSYELVRETWQATMPAPDFEAWWLRTVETGIIPGSTAGPVTPPRMPSLPNLTLTSTAEGLTLLFRADPTVWDGRYANNAWLQECPKPVTHETWGNALHVAPADAERLGLASGDAVRIEVNGRSLEAPLLVDNGQAAGTILLSLGYGRRRVGAIGEDLGVDAYQLRTSGTLWIAGGAKITKIGRAEEIPRTQTILNEEGRDLAPEMRLVDLASGKRLRERPDPPTLYPDQPYEAPYLGAEEDYAWAMVIDTTLCIGCNACVIACQSENNVPVVGPDEIRAGRTMHWLRIDTYEKTIGDEERSLFQPVPCMHCEKAPCEPVCPVGASVHDHEGLNVQIYNRCVGTRFCQANCPYKVRRFNWFGYGAGQEYENMGEEPLQARLNPNVTVRGRGVMEKCTYCVQRISDARRDAEAEGRRIRDGEVVTACASACPTQAIRFGDLNSADATVRALREEPQHYALLDELGTKPRTTYLARVRNANPDLAGDGE